MMTIIETKRLAKLKADSLLQEAKELAAQSGTGDRFLNWIDIQNDKLLQLRDELIQAGATQRTAETWLRCVISEFSMRLSA
jgi:translation initiation factor 1 (eIF-1/SUI1)